MKCLLFVLKIDTPSPTQAGFVGAPETDFTCKECREYRFRTTLLKLGECSCRDLKHNISLHHRILLVYHWLQNKLELLGC